MSDWISSVFDGSFLSGGVFLIIGIIGALLLLISLLLGGIFDAFDFGDGPLSLTTIAAFAAIFGFASYASVGSGIPSPAAALIGLGSGLAGGAFAWWLSRFFTRAESNSSTSTSTLVGQEAHVILPLPGGSGLGEISFVRHGERVSLSARCEAPVLAGARVRIVAIVTDTSVLVEPIQ